MREIARFNIVFAKLHELLESDEREGQAATILIRKASEITAEELEELDELRRTILEVTDPQSTSYTTT